MPACEGESEWRRNSSSLNWGQRDHLAENARLFTGPVPIVPHYCPDFFKREKKQIFERAWLLVCREEELAAPGSFAVKELPPTSVNALITRSKNGKIQAFHNTCSHRGSQIVYATEGRQSRFVCPYHRWTYTNEGALIGLPTRPISSTSTRSSAA